VYREKAAMPLPLFFVCAAMLNLRQSLLGQSSLGRSPFQRLPFAVTVSLPLPFAAAVLKARREAYKRNFLFTIIL
jgi:hypothetical protein